MSREDGLGCVGHRPPVAQPPPVSLADTGAEVVLDSTGSGVWPHNVVCMDFRDELQIGDHTYGVCAKREPAQDGQPTTVAVEFTGADTDARIVAEGNLLVAVDGILDLGQFLARTLDGLAALHGQKARIRARPRPPNAGQPWTEALSEALSRRWLHCADTGTGSELVGGLAQEFGRTRSSVRAQLARLGCDPDVPGRRLPGGAQSTGTRSTGTQSVGAEPVTGAETTGESSAGTAY